MMKKKTYHRIILCLLSVFGLFGCEDFLSEVPDSRLTIDTPEKISELLTSAYLQRSRALITHSMSDNADDKGSQLWGNPDDTNSKMYLWKDVQTLDLDTPNTYWNACYTAIANANQALESIKELKAQNPNVDLNGQEGEALVCRAYAHFMLVNLWAKHYDPKTAAKDLGIPIVNSPEKVVLKEYHRNSVAEVYDFIQKDLEKGIPLIKNTYKVPKYHFTTEAAKAFASLFYLYKADWDKVIEYADAILTDPANQIRNLNNYVGLQYSQILATYISVDQPTNLLLTTSESLWGRRFATSRYALSFKKVKELFVSDSNPFDKNWGYAIYGIDGYYNIPKIPEYFKYTNVSAGIGYPFITEMLITYDQVLLNRAEALVMKEKFAEALEDLNVYLPAKTRDYNPNHDYLTEEMIRDYKYSIPSKNFKPFYPLSDRQALFINFIAELWRRESYHQGDRWFDIRRFNLGFTHKFYEDEKPKAELDSMDLRKQLQIPNTVISRGLKPNPRKN